MIIKNPAVAKDYKNGKEAALAISRRAGYEDFRRQSQSGEPEENFWKEKLGK